MSELHELTDKTIDEFIGKSQSPVFVDLWADWCRPCKMIEPMIKNLADEYSGKMVFTKLNTDSNRKTAEKYAVRTLPMFLILDATKGTLDKITGAIPRQKLVEKINASLKQD